MWGQGGGRGCRSPQHLVEATCRGELGPPCHLWKLLRFLAQGQAVDICLPPPRSRAHPSTAAQPRHGPGWEKSLWSQLGDAKGSMLPCEPQLSPRTLPSAVSCGNQENHWCHWGQPHGCSRMVGLSLGGGSLTYAPQRCVVCFTAGNNLAKENALQHHPPESSPSPLLRHRAQSEATCELIKPVCPIKTSPPDSLASTWWHGGHSCAIWGSSAWHRAPRCDTGLTGDHAEHPVPAHGGGRAAGAQP